MPKELLQEVFELGPSVAFPNVTIALRIFVTLPASVASGERSSNVLKQVNSCQRSTVGQDRLNGFTTVSINCDLARKPDSS
jgi:hypothetical protein